MPFNRINNVKATSLWLAILQRAENEERESKARASEGLVSKEITEKQRKYYNVLRALTYARDSCWIPGINIVPIPEAGWFLGYVDVAFWATFLYLFGSILYVVDSFYLWVRVNPDYTDDAWNPAIYLNTMAGAMFVLNALVCFLDWYLQVRQLSAMNYFIDEDITGGLHISDIPTKITWYYFLNNFFFLGAAIIYLMQALWAENANLDLEHCADKL